VPASQTKPPMLPTAPDRLSKTCQRTEGKTIAVKIPNAVLTICFHSACDNRHFCFNKTNNPE
jgi:hypothetical protein